MSKTGGDENSCASENGQINLLTAITLFIRDCAPHLIKIPNLLYPSINLYQQALQSTQDDVSWLNFQDKYSTEVDKDLFCSSGKASRI